MDNKSFSLQFNPLLNVKCVKDYEEEINNLKAENFELKAQLTHSNIPKVLYENKQELDQIQAQKQEIQNAYENLNKTHQNLIQEKKLLENKYNQDIALASEKNAFLEDENKRILLRLEKLNREVQEAIGMKNEFNSLKDMIQNHERQFEQQKYVYERELEENRMKFDNYRLESDNTIRAKDFQMEKLRKDAENEIKSKDLELENLRKKIEQMNQKEKNNSFVITDLKATINSQMKDRTYVEDLMNMNQQLESEKMEKEQALERIKKEQKIYLSGMEKFRTVVSKKMNEVMVQLQGVNENFLKLKLFCHISDENLKLLTKLNVKWSNFNDLIGFFKEKHAEAHKRIEVLKKEASDAVFFASNNKATVDKKTLSLLQEFKDQFNEAKNELLVCKRYLEKKALENKALKNENGRLVSEMMMKSKQIEQTKKIYDMAINRTDAMRI